jgi:hypothetical protein
MKVSGRALGGDVGEGVDDWACGNRVEPSNDSAAVEEDIEGEDVGGEEREGGVGSREVFVVEKKGSNEGAEGRELDDGEVDGSVLGVIRELVTEEKKLACVERKFGRGREVDEANTGREGGD